MRLILEVVDQEAVPPNAARRWECGEAGGTIGRFPSNDWVLPDKIVSGRHAKILFVNGAFYIEDTSTNGVFVDEVPVGHRNRAQLTDRATIRIDPFQMRVSVVDDPAWPGLAQQSPESESETSGDISLSSLLGPTPKPPSMGTRHEQGFAGGSVADRPYQPPVPPEPAGGQESAERERYDPFNDPGSLIGQSAPDPVRSPDRPVSPVDQKLGPPVPEPPRADQPVRAPAPAPASGPRTPGDVTLAAVLEGAGFSGVAVTPELARDFGEILRIVVAGMMDVLQARQRIKDEFGVERTRYQALGNNPLKFSVDVDEALHKLLVQRHKAYLGPVEAFDDAFADIRNHEMAMLAGMRVAFQAMLDRFNPERLKELFERDAKKSSLLAVGTKLKYWDRYCEMVRDMVSDADESFRTLFGDEFARAYEEQLGRLKGKGRREPPAKG